MFNQLLKTPSITLASSQPLSPEKPQYFGCFGNHLPVCQELVRFVSKFSLNGVYYDSFDSILFTLPTITEGHSVLLCYQCKQKHGDCFAIKPEVGMRSTYSPHAGRTKTNAPDKSGSIITYSAFLDQHGLKRELPVLHIISTRYY